MAKKIPATITIYPLVIGEICVGIIVAGLALLLFADLSSEVLSEEIHTLDHDLSLLIYGLRSPWLTRIMLSITFLGSSFFLGIASVSLFLFLLYKRYWHEATLFTLTFGIGVLLNLFLKYVVGRARPDIDPLIHEVFYSYPSGHSMNAFVFYALLAYLMYHFTRKIQRTLLISAILGMIILLIGISRIYLGVHYPSDVAAGFLVGAGWLVTVFVVDKTLQAFHYYKRRTSTV